jgi:hypothetical protein
MVSVVGALAMVDAAYYEIASDSLADRMMSAIETSPAATGREVEDRF